MTRLKKVRSADGGVKKVGPRPRYRIQVTMSHRISALTKGRRLAYEHAQQRRNTLEPT